MLCYEFKYKYLRPKECLFNGDGIKISKRFKFPASYVYNCDCKEYFYIDEIFRNISCPFCAKNNPEAQQEFKDIIFVNAVLKNDYRWANKLLDKGAKISITNLHKFPRIYDFLEKFPEQVDKNNLDHYQIIKESMKLYDVIDAKYFSDKNLMSIEKFLELFNFCLHTYKAYNSQEYMVRARYLESLKEYAKKYPDKLELCKELDKDEWNTDLITEFALDYNVDVQKLENFDKNFKNMYYASRYTINKLLKINPKFLYDDYFIEKSDINGIREFIKLRPELRLKDFKSIVANMNRDLFDKSCSYNYQKLLKNMKEELPKDEKGNDFQMRAIMMDDTDLDLIDGIRKDIPVNKKGFNDFSLSILYGSEKFFEKYLPVSDLEHFDNDGRTPIMMSINANQPKMLYELLKNKANYRAKDFDGLSCYDYARSTSNYKTKTIFYTMVIKDIIKKNISKLYDLIKIKLPKNTKTEEVPN